MKRRQKICSLLLLFLSLAVLVFSLSKLIPILMDYRGSEQTYESLKETCVEDLGDTSETEEEEKQEDWEKIHISFDELKKENPDIVAWIRFDNTDQVAVDYPVLYSGDNETYLRHDIYGSYHIAGCIFLEGRNQPDFSDYHSIIYGHNMKNSTMFGDLKKYKNQKDFYEKNPYFTVYTPESTYRYHIFSYYDAEETSDVYTVGYEPGERFQDLLKKMTECSMKKTGVYPEDTDRILTLSTCSTDGEDKRFVIHAMRIN